MSELTDTQIRDIIASVAKVQQTDFRIDPDGHVWFQGSDGWYQVALDARRYADHLRHHVCVDIGASSI